MSKVKMRCITCGKWFQSANAKEVTCPDCTQKARKDKMAQKKAPPASSKPIGPSRPQAPSRPKPVQSGTTHWLDNLNDVKISQPEPPAISRGTAPPYREGGGRSAGPSGYRESDYRESGYRGNEGSPYFGSLGQHYRPPQEGFPGHGPRPGTDKPRFNGPGNVVSGVPRLKSSRPQSPPKPKREKMPPPQPFIPTPEQVTQVEERYLELVAPSEFDGIRTQIAREVGIPKKAVKKIVKELRARRDIPSWWELQIYKGSKEELDKISAAYEPLLPLPPVGVHKLIAEQLELKPGIVYQAIKTIRLEMNLPQYNAPELHGEEFLAQESSDSKQDEATVETKAPRVEDTVTSVAASELPEEQR